MFENFAKAVSARFNEMVKSTLFVTECPDLFDKYLAAFPAGTNPVLRKRTEHDCQTCKQFIRTLGRTVNILNGQVKTVWDDLDVSGPYRDVASRLSEVVRNSPVMHVFLTEQAEFGREFNYDEKTRDRYNHLCGKVAAPHRVRDAGTKLGELNSTFQVAKRGLTELRAEHLRDVLDLIAQNGLYRGEEHRPAITGFLELLEKFNQSGRSDLFVWEHLNNRNARFRNTAIGTLMVDLAEGKELDQAVRAFETKVAPMNYKRPTSIITQKMVEQAVETLNSLGLTGATQRRFARLSDVSVNDVLFVSNDCRSKMKDGVTLLLEESISKPKPDLAKAVKIEADEFVRTVLPKARELELFLESRHVGNFVSLTGGDGPERLFKWDNNFAWSYDGDVADSVKQRVKAAGGNIHADIRVSLSWFNFDDLDLHAVTPDGSHVYFNNKQGILDVDMNAGSVMTRNPVENLAFNRPRDGNYRVYVHQYRRRETIDVGFAIEIEAAGVVHRYSYPRSVASEVPCFQFTVRNGALVSVEADPRLVQGSASTLKWGVKTENLIPVTAAMYSPNYWGDQRLGQKHLIFALKDCRNPEPTRGIYNDFLRSDLDKHRKVFEVLGAKTRCKPTDDQISGVGFTWARGDSVTVVVDGRRSYTLCF